MSKRKGSDKIVSILLLVGLCMAAVIYMPAILGAADEGVDLTGTDYEDQYDSNTDTSILTLNMFQIVPILLVIGGVLVGLKYLIKM